MSEQAVLDAESAKNESSFKPVKMPQEVQNKMESTFGYDLSKVKMTESSYAETIGARAYAKGDTIHFAPGEFNPLSGKGQELIGHEIGHVVQQSRGEVRSQGKIGEDPVNLNSDLEAKADLVGSKAAQHNEQSASGEMQSLEVAGEGVIQGAWQDKAKTFGTAAGGVGQLSGLVGGGMGLAAAIMGDDAPEWLKITGAAASFGGNLGGAAEWGTTNLISSPAAGTTAGTTAAGTTAGTTTATLPPKPTVAAPIPGVSPKPTAAAPIPGMSPKPTAAAPIPGISPKPTTAAPKPKTH